ncbi:MAG: SpoIIE family protein phosphatase [Eubacterium sp.]|nr:SpoIIE family protein phosphatase [Eubacterium sp.]
MKTIYRQILAITLVIVSVLYLCIIGVMIVELTTHRDSVEERVVRVRENADEQSKKIEEELTNVIINNNPNDLREVEQVANEFKDDILKDTDDAIKGMEDLLRHLVIEAIIAAAIGLVLTLVLVFILARRIVRPITQLISQIDEIGGGNLDKEIKVDAKNEIGKLAEKFNKMSSDLKNHVEKVKKMAADNERMFAEYSVTQEMRNDLLPNNSISTEHYQICAKLRSGHNDADIYNWIQIDDQHLALLVADSTGEGVLAMVQLMMTGAYIGVFSRMGYSPSRVIAETNNQLSNNNAVNSSISIIYAIIDLKSGQLTYVNAGSEPILMKHTGEDFAFLSGNEDLPVGQMENIPYRKNSIRLTQGDILVFYTHGIPESCDSKGNYYSREALAGTLDNVVKQYADCEHIAEALMNEVNEFTGDVEQVSEGTILAFRYMG